MPFPYTVECGKYRIRRSLLYGVKLGLFSYVLALALSVPILYKKSHRKRAVEYAKLTHDRIVDVAFDLSKNATSIESDFFKLL